MENVKFVRTEEKGRILYLYFKIHDRVADFIRKHTHYYEALLSDFLDTDIHWMELSVLMSLGSC